MKNAVFPWKKPVNRFFFIVVASVFFLINCSSFPEKDPGGRLGVLPSDSSIYVSGKIKKNKTFFNSIFVNQEGEDFSSIVKRIDKIYAAFSSGSNDRMPGFSAVVVGSFPLRILERFFRKNEDWIRVEKGNSGWWLSKSRGISIALLEKSLIFISLNGIEEMISRYNGKIHKKIPAVVADELDLSDLLLYIPEVEDEMLKRFSVDVDRYSVEELCITANITGKKMVCHGRLIMETDDQARKFKFVVKLLIYGWLKKEKIGDIHSLKKKLGVKNNQKILTISGLELTSDDIIVLIKQLSEKKDENLRD